MMKRNTFVRYEKLMAKLSWYSSSALEFLVLLDPGDIESIS